MKQELNEDRTGYANKFATLPLNVQQELTELVDDMYEPYDCTDLQELAAIAYLAGRERYALERREAERKAESIQCA